MPGARFARRYLVERHLGQGGMGAVYAVRDELLDEAVALKLAAWSLTERVAVESLRREVSLARRVTHPNVARVYDLGLDQGRLFMTLELVDGVSLDRRLRAGALPVSEVVWIGHQIASALTSAHAAGVLHLDLKPGNVMVANGQELRVVIVDFGIARAIGARAAGFGTPGYMAPEQLLDEPLGGAADIYALGLILYRALLGRSAFADLKGSALIFARLEGAPPKLSPGLPPALAELVESMLARRPAERPTAADVAAALARSAVTDLPPVSSLVTSIRSSPEGLFALPIEVSRRLVAARARLSAVGGEEEAIEASEAALALAPNLDVALAVRALARVRKWGLTSFAAEAAFLPDLATQAVSEAIAHAPHLPDSHLADALVADAGGDIAYAVRALRRALALDPLHAFSHAVLGRIELEAGASMGERTELARELDSGHVGVLLVAARERFFRGEDDAGSDLLQAAEAHTKTLSWEAFTLRVRLSIWRRDRTTALRLLGELPADGPPFVEVLRHLLEVLLGDGRCATSDEFLQQLLALPSMPKRRIFFHQLWAELCAAHRREEALHHVVSAAHLPLTDLRWLDACPGLEVVREHPTFQAAAATVRRRVSHAFGAPDASHQSATDGRPQEAQTTLLLVRADDMTVRQRLLSGVFQSKARVVQR